MKKTLVSRNFYNRFEEELNKHQAEGRISEEQVGGMLETYELKEKISFIKVIVTLSVILIGLGVLSFIASNWILFGKATKFFIIVIAYVLASIAGMKIEKIYPKTGRSLIYLSIVIFGAGIFLIGQTFHFGGRFTSAFLLWALGIIPLTIMLKDKGMFTFLHLLLLVYLNGQYVYDDFPIFLLIIIPFLYYANKRFEVSWTIFFTNLVTLNFVWYILDEWMHVENDLIILLFFIIGLLMYYFPFSFYQAIYRLQGMAIFGIFGWVLTCDNTWNDYVWIRNIDLPFNIIFTLIYVLLLLYFVRRESLIALFFIGLTILRFYFDEMYDFMPKSIFFLTSGLLLLGFGYYFERKRKQLKEENK